MDRGVWWTTVCGVAESDMTEQLNTAQHNLKYSFPQKIAYKSHVTWVFPFVCGI